MIADSFPDTPACSSLLARMHEIHDLDKAAAVLAWDRDMNMPRAGLTGRIQQMKVVALAREAAELYGYQDDPLNICQLRPGTEASGG